jgi:signal recognition particle GTPase|tara:strand:+ start:1429 stop:1797 length:369 start_codon:yes stop_codon:yes gene_type:complete
MFMGDETEKKSLEKQQKICAALTEEEMNGEITLTREDKKEVAEVTQCTIDDVNDTLSKFKQMGGFHKYLKDKRARNEPMPESNEDLTMMYKIERPSFLIAKPNYHRNTSPKVILQSKFRKHT